MFDPRNSTSRRPPAGSTARWSSPSSNDAWCPTTVTRGASESVCPARASAMAETSTRCAVSVVDNLLHERQQLAAVAGTQFYDRGQLRKRSENVAAMRRQQAVLGARDAVPRQLADGVEQRRAERVVEIPATAAAAGSAADSDVRPPRTARRRVSDACVIGDHRRRRDERTGRSRTRTDSAAGTSCGKSA